MEKAYKWIILALILLVGGFFLYRHFKTEICSEYLRDQTGQLQKDIDKLIARDDSLINKTVKDSLFIADLLRERKEIENELIKNDKDIRLSRNRLYELLNDQDMIMAQIKHLEDYPPNRQGEELLESLKQKINEK